MPRVSTPVGVSLVVLLTAGAPLSVLAWAEADRLADMRHTLDHAELRAAALAAAVVAEEAAREGRDPLRAAVEAAPAGANVLLVDAEGNWRARDGTTGRDPRLAATVAGPVAGAGDVSLPGSSAPRHLAWGRASVEGQTVVLVHSPHRTDLALVAPYVAASGAAVLGAGVVGVAVARRAAAPLQRLERAAERLADGAWDEPVPVEGGPEVRSLAQALQRMADDLAAQHAELERLVADRTARLVESRHDLDAVHFTVAHELREPLRSIRTAADVVLDDRDSEGEDAAHALALIRAKAGRLERLLLDLERYDAISRSALQPADVSLDEILGDAADEVQESAPLDVATEPLPRMRADAAQLRLAFVEALRNATQHGARHVRVRARERGEDVLVRFDDDGPGVAPARREDAFQLFQRLRPDSPGSGVGLPIVRRVAERHGGSARLAQAPEGGARLELRLPKAGPPERAPEPDVVSRTF